MGQKLEMLDIPVLFLGSLFERPEVKDLLSLVSLLVDRRAMGLVRTACLPEFEMTLGDVAAVIGHLRDYDLDAGSWRSLGGALDSLSAESRSGLVKVAAALEGFDGSASPWDVIATVLLDRTRMAANLAQSSKAVDRARGIATWQLMNFV
jgi:hypothetical protein